MITLAVASAFQTLASQLSEFTGGEDGLNFKVPECCRPAFSLSEQPFLGVSLDGKLISYYSLFALGVVLFLVMLRIVNSPFGRVLQAIRENAFRAEALGYPLVVYRTWSNVLSAGFATLAGALLALWLRYNGPDTSLSFDIMIDILLMVVIGGMGTMYGAVLGATLFIVAQNYLQDLMRLASDAARRRARCCRLGAPGPLAAVAGDPVHRQRLPLSCRHRRQAARQSPREAMTRRAWRVPSTWRVAFCAVGCATPWCRNRSTACLRSRCGCGTTRIPKLGRTIC